ncbi:UNVERIFIED_CONTAM: phosphoglycerate dehydrogenase-like enzyme [Acetivibrio alkalicellulosi]
MKRLLLTGAFNYTKDQIDELVNLGYEIIFVQDERVCLDFDVCDIDVVVCNSLFLYNDIREFKKLKIIQLTSAGLERVPLDYIYDHKIQIFNAKDVYSIPMAEWIVLKILEIYKRSMFFYKNQEKQKWLKNRDLIELTDKKALILGFGNVGSEVAKRLKAFGVYTIGVDIRMVESDYLDKSFLISDIDKILEICDIVILTLPITNETRHIINKDKLEMMKDNAVIVNVSRGDLIDERALIEVLNNGKFLGVALDVFKEEPLGESPLWYFKNVIITPHNSFVSDKVSERLFRLMTYNLRKGETL